MPTKRVLAGLFVLPALASCSALLDFDALQKGTGGGAGVSSGAAAGSVGTGGSVAGSGSGGTGGSGGEGGVPEGGAGGTAGKGGAAGTGGSSANGGAAECPTECFHDDPCLVDGCNSDGSCKTDHVLGLSLDGVDETIASDHQFRVTMVGGDDAFFLSSLTATGDKPEVTFYRLDATAPDVMPIATIGGLAINGTGAPASAAGLAYQPVLGLVHAYVALTDRVGMAARVWHLVLGTQGTSPKPMPVGALTDGYFTGSPYNYPAALFTANQPYAAWINADQTIGLSDGSGTPPQLLAAGGKATTLALFSSADGQPGVLYSTAGGGVFAERPGVTPFALDECQPAAGDYLSISATSATLPGLWLGGWTKFGAASGTDPGYLTTNGRAFGCSADGCGNDMSACPGDSDNNLVRNPASVIAHRPGDPPGLMQLVQAAPLLVADGDQVGAQLFLIQESANFDTKGPATDPAIENIAPPIALNSQPTSEAAGFQGPDWPAVAFVSPDKFAVAWTQPSVTQGGPDELRLQRYKMCLPPPK